MTKYSYKGKFFFEAKDDLEAAGVIKAFDENEARLDGLKAYFDQQKGYIQKV